MKKLRIIQILFLAFGLICYASCKDDEPCEDFTATYNGDVKEIINKGCSYEGCHSGATASVSVPSDFNDFTSYAGLKSVIDTTLFSLRVLEEKSMPPSGGTPSELTEAELEILTCWKDAGYPEG